MPASHFPQSSVAARFAARLAQVPKHDVRHAQVDPPPKDIVDPLHQAAEDAMPTQKDIGFVPTDSYEDPLTLIMGETGTGQQAAGPFYILYHEGQEGYFYADVPFTKEEADATIQDSDDQD